MACNCKLVGNLKIGVEGVFSVNVSYKSDVVVDSDGVAHKMPPIMSITINAYAFYSGRFVQSSCVASVSASLGLERIYDCYKEVYVYFYTNVNNINISGKPDNIIIYDEMSLGIGYNASASSGPYNMYSDEPVSYGSGFKYKGPPILVDTKYLDLYNVLNLKCVLRSFSYNSGNNSVPTVSYVFEYSDNMELLKPKGDRDDKC